MTLSDLQSAAARGTPRVLLLAAVLLLAPAAAFAHAKLLRSEPKAKSSLPRPPAAVELWFSEELQPGFNAVEVKDAGGGRFDRGEVSLGEGGKKVRVELRDLPAGAYTVEWKALSADQHTLRGKFSFTVEAAAPAEATSEGRPPEGPAGGVVRQTPTSPPGGHDTPDAGGVSVDESTLTAADSLVRWLGYLAMMTLAGGFASLLLVLGPALRKAGSAEAAVGTTDAFFRRSVSLFRVSVAALILSILAALALQSSALHGVGLAAALTPSRLRAVITGTGYGRPLLVQALGTAALVVIVLFLGRAFERAAAARHKGLLAAGLAASSLTMLGPSLMGHAAVAAKHHSLAVFSDWLHIVAAGFWVGGLFHLAIVLPPALSALPGGLRAEALGLIIRSFTRVAAPAVALITLAGLYNSWLHVGDWRGLWTTTYGKTLLFKLLLVVAMLALGALNNFHFGRRVRRAAGGGGADPGRGFGRSLKLEAALGTLVLLATAFLVFTSPGRNDATGMTQDRGASPARSEQR